jgi:hypothetical protein
MRAAIRVTKSPTQEEPWTGVRGDCGTSALEREVLMLDYVAFSGAEDDFEQPHCDAHFDE